MSDTAASPPSRELGSITMAGFGRTSRGMMLRSDYRHFGQYAVVYVYAGSGRYVDEQGVDRAIGAGDLIYVFPTLGHRYGPVDGATWEESFLVFDGPICRLWEETGLLCPQRPVAHLAPTGTWRRRWENVVVGGTSRAGPRMGLFPAAAALEMARLHLALAEAAAAREPAAPRDAERLWAEEACAALENSPQLDVEAIAEQMHCSIGGFRRRFTRAVGVPPARYRATRTIERACELMQQTDLADKQIAAELGFCDEYHFSRRFKQLMGMSPRVYRHRMP